MSLLDEETARGYLEWFRRWHWQCVDLSRLPPIAPSDFVLLSVPEDETRSARSPRLARLIDAVEEYVGDSSRVEDGPIARRAARELRDHGERLGRSYADQFRPYLPPTTLDTVALGVSSEVVDEFVALEAALAATTDLAARRKGLPEK